MNEKARQARNQYMREWRRKNPEKVKANKARYWERRAAKMEAEAKQDGKSD